MIRAPRPPDLSLADLGAPYLAFVVVGVPGPQGSKTVVPTKNGGHVVKESSAKVKPWRLRVATAALDAVSQVPGFVRMDGPLVADMIFTYPRPASTPKSKRRLPVSSPDLSKVLRATEDALDVDANVIANDARIVTYRTLSKVLEGDPWASDALPHPGAVVRLWHYPEHLASQPIRWADQ